MKDDIDFAILPQTPLYHKPPITCWQMNYVNSCFVLHQILKCIKHHQPFDANIPGHMFYVVEHITNQCYSAYCTMGIRWYQEIDHLKMILMFSHGICSILTIWLHIFSFRQFAASPLSTVTGTIMLTIKVPSSQYVPLVWGDGRSLFELIVTWWRHAAT